MLLVFPVATKMQPLTTERLMCETTSPFDPRLVDASPHNRPTPLAKLQPLIESIRAKGQLQPGRVRHHPTLPGRFECDAREVLAGPRRNQRRV